ncbi:hypothetical protein GCM10023115_32330 [Pontixanthobacter gangjinensis]|uniref:hypothetical protein n=1 Tax=Christiangramia aestuarii TaxID=1028746 RepID=UPI0012E1DC51|nr:hypothetical protein [Christiangramia aestuarii]
MKKELKVLEFSKKRELLEYVNSRENIIEIISISTCQVATSYSHFLWYYED